MDLRTPVRVVVFTAGPTLLRGVTRFISELERQPDIDLLAVVRESRVDGPLGVVRDTFARRKLLAVPVLLMRGASVALSVVRSPRSWVHDRRSVSGLADRHVVVDDIHSDSAVGYIRSLSAQIGLVYGSPILKPIVFTLPAQGTLGIHHGKLPQYRGKKTTFWALLNRERTVGVTIQRINAGLDTGEVVLAAEIPTAGRSLRRVWNELENLGLQLYIEAIRRVAAGTADYHAVDGPKGKLYRDPTVRDIFRYYVRRLKR